MVSNKTVSLALLSFLCAASAASAKFSFSREQLRQFDIRRRHTTVGPSNAFRPAAATAAVSTVTVTVSTTSTTTSTATTTSISTTTSQTTASTTITDTITTSAGPAPAVVQMHTTHIAILPRATKAAHAKLRMRKLRRTGLSSGRAEDEDADNLGAVALATPSEDIAAMKQVHHQRAAPHVDEHPPSGTHALLEARARPLNDVENLPVDASTGALGAGQSATTATSATENSVNGGLDSAQNGLVDVVASDATAASTDTVDTEAAPVLAVADGTSSSAVGSVVKTASPGTGDSSGIIGIGASSNADSLGSSDLLSVGLSPIVEVDLL